MAESTACEWVEMEQKIILYMLHRQMILKIWLSDLKLRRGAWQRDQDSDFLIRD